MTDPYRENRTQYVPEMQGFGSQFELCSLELAHSLTGNDELLGEINISRTTATGGPSTAASFISSWRHAWATHDLGLFGPPNKSGRSETSIEAVRSGPCRR